MKLSKYTNNLFATHATLDSALSYAQDVADGSNNPAAVMTAVQAVLNTAIAMHHAELAAVNKPLIELIDARVAAALMELKGSLEDMETNLDDKITEAINDLDIDGKITEAINEYDFSEVVERAMENNPIDVEALLSGTNISITFD